MRVLITGISGFVGGHLARRFSGRPGTKLFGVARSLAPVPAGAEFIRADLKDFDAVRLAVRESRPDRIYHLAGQASAVSSLDEPRDTLDRNVLGPIHLLEAVRAEGLNPRILMVGSSEAYGTPRPEDLPIRETAVFRPVTPYGVSKAAQDLLAFQYAHVHGMAIVRVRPFLHAGPGQNSRYIVGDFADQIAAIEKGLQRPELLTGNLDLDRDFTDVRDVVRAYELVLEKGRAGEAYNVCSGRAVRLKDLADIFLRLARGNIKIEVKREPARLRGKEAPCITGDPSKLMKETGWRPEIAIERMLEDVLNERRGMCCNGV